MLVAILVLLIAWLTLHFLLRSGPITEPFILSHRGAAAHAPENTLAGISEAAERGARMVEVDVQRSADGVLVLMHDTTVDRTTDGTGPVRALSWEALRTLDAGAHFGEAFAGEPVPRLESAMELAAEAQIHLVLEAKSPDLYPGLELQMAEQIEALGMEEQVTVVSFDHDWLRRFQAVAPTVPIGRLYVWMGALEETPEAALVDVYWLNVILDPTLVRRAHSKGYPVVVWTVNSAWCMKLLLWLGVDGITTDRPTLGGRVLSVFQ